ncbi:MAG: hypothetical protein J6M05_05390 [Cardiobacteriaceae bacterium]|nr:hypothetical protein [Cardiobacteriaceae bacterium]
MKIIFKGRETTLISLDAKSLKFIKEAFNNVATNFIPEEFETIIGCEYEDFLHIYHQIHSITGDELHIKNEYNLTIYNVLNESTHAIGIKGMSPYNKKYLDDLMDILASVID